MTTATSIGLGSLLPGVTGGENTVVGIDATALNASVYRSTLVGNTTQANERSVAVGWKANATGVLSIAIGVFTTATDYSVVIGTGADSTGGDSSVIVGNDAVAQTTGSVAVGYGAEVFIGDYGIAIGLNSRSMGTDAIALGDAANAGHTNAVAIGASATTNADNDFVLGVAANNVRVPGTFTLSANPAMPMQASTKQYVDARTPPILVLGPTDPVPGGTPAGTVIIRKES